MTADLTKLLQRWQDGDESARAAAMEEVYPLLRALAHRQLNHGASLTLQPTELAHEAYLKLLDQRRIEWQSRGHFYAIAARVVRRVVIDYLRERQAQKRGGGEERLSLEAMDESDHPQAEAGIDWLRLDRVLEELEGFNAEGARLVEQRYFVGMSVPEIAQSWGVSESTIARQWRSVRAWLELRLAGLGD